MFPQQEWYQEEKQQIWNYLMIASPTYYVSCLVNHALS